MLRHHVKKVARVPAEDRGKWAGGMGEVVAMETGEAGALKTGGSECSELPCVKGGQWVKAEVTGELLAISQ